MNEQFTILADETRLHEKQFLIDISEQNYSKYNVELPSSGHDRYWHKILLSYAKGKSYKITRSNANEISLTSIAVLADIWYRNDNLRPNIQIHRPVYDSSVKGLSPHFHSFRNF